MIETYKKFPLTHRIDVLWKRARFIMRNLYPDSVNIELDYIEKYILEIAENDPFSIGFRYPSNKKRENSIPKNLRHINLRKFGEIMESISSLLDGAILDFTLRVDDKLEMEFYMQEQNKNYDDYFDCDIANEYDDYEQYP